MNSINFFDEHNLIPNFNSEFFSLWLKNIEKEDKVIIGNLNYIIYPNSLIRKMNLQYLNHDYDTDVITFDYSDQNVISGDVFINFDFIKSFSKQNNIKFINELSRVIIHGTLHLCGYNDDSTIQKQEMTARENFYLSLL